MAVKNRVDYELNLLKPLGDQGLFSEDWTKNTYNDERMFRASGEECKPEYSNFSIAFIANALTKNYTKSDCKNDCKALFGKGEEKTLQKACISLCKSKCQDLNCHSHKPSRKGTCLYRGLTADCKTPEGKVATDDVIEEMETKTKSASADSGSYSEKSSSTGSNMSTGAKVGIILGVVVVLGGIGYLVLRKKK